MVLKPDKVKPVKQQLSSIHPEVLLFLSETAVSISNRINLENKNAESYILHLSLKENGDAKKQCNYYMWKQKFPVRLDNVVERRKDVEEWIITLEFPIEGRLHRGMMSLPGVYAFLPTEMVTNFPFIIQADFVLASSRETILLDDKWNEGILECVPSAFMDAFRSLALPLILGSDQVALVSSRRLVKLNIISNKIRSEVLQEGLLSALYHLASSFYLLQLILSSKA